MSEQNILKDLRPENEFFIGIDSDGCAFDTMEIKHKECFCPNFIKHFELQKIQKYARETWDFVNLYSQSRGYNRFLAVIEAIQLLDKRPQVHDRSMVLPDITDLIDWTKKETKLGNPALEKYVNENGIPILMKALEWSKGVNASVAEMVYGMPPFPGVEDSLEIMRGIADVVVVSQTPLEALEREWKENGLDSYVRLIAGQELGTKAEHIAFAAKGKYPDDHILMVGDAPGDYSAAKSNGVLFFPINPGHEEESWKRLHDEGLNRFFNGKFAGSYEDRLVEDFQSFLPSQPDWEQIN
jgi:phosphoglycolate phosphatase-like HAD superfamily hydrolase